MRRFLDPFWLTGITESRLVYLGTAVGFLWPLARPLMLFGAVLFASTQVFGVDSNQHEHGCRAAADRTALGLLPGIDPPTRVASVLSRDAPHERPGSRAW